MQILNFNPHSNRFQMCSEINFSSLYCFLSLSLAAFFLSSLLAVCVCWATRPEKKGSSLLFSSPPLWFSFPLFVPHIHIFIIKKIMKEGEESRCVIVRTCFVMAITQICNRENTEHQERINEEMILSVLLEDVKRLTIKSKQRRWREDNGSGSS